MNIKEKLQFIEAFPRQKQVVAKVPSSNPEKPALEQILGGGFRKNDHGSFFCIEKNYPLDYRHGNEEISSLLNRSSALLQIIGKDPTLQNLDLKRTLFIDTETTGLAGGSGTYPFLIGMGFFHENCFQTIQFFMNDLNEEKPLLHELNGLVEQFDLLVSFNGKCYDVPLLITRNILHRIKSPLLKVSHLDLLFTVRRLWKHRLADCSLNTAENRILGVSRKGDIPGYLIPYTYFRFLRDRNAEPLKPVFYHNQQDILSMLSIMSKALGVVDNPFDTCRDSRDFMALGKVYEGMAHYEQSIDLYEKYLQKNAVKNGRQEILMRMAFNYKKLEEWSKAKKAWQECLNTEAFHPIPYIELAKHYEHRMENISKAKFLVDKALAEMKILDTLGRKIEWIDFNQDLEYRLKRLKRKLRDEK